MKKLFLAGCLLLLTLEILMVYLIMPMPGSQQMDSISIAYFLYSYRWILRALIGLLMLIGLRPAWQGGQKWWSLFLLLVTTGVTVLCNLELSADHMFLPMKNKLFRQDQGNREDSAMLVLGVSIGKDARAYPIRYLVYHHQLIDTLGGERIMVTYCSVCRTGRVYRPESDNQPEHFRLVGMDHFNALFEDSRTKSWWRQSTGLCIAGPLKGRQLQEVHSVQATWGQWLQSFPQSLLLMPDSSFLNDYDMKGKYERGESHGGLTGTDTVSWNPKSWVVGIEMNGQSRAYDWKYLQQQQIIRDSLNGKAILLLLAMDGKNFVALQVPTIQETVFRNDSLLAPFGHFSFSSLQSLPDSAVPKKLDSYQEFWHSWKTFHPKTSRYPK